MITKAHNWRRRRQANQLILTIVDHDTKRFAVEGTVESEEPWAVEVYRARRAGRQIDFSLVDTVRIDAALLPWRQAGYEEWPRSSIILV